MTKYIGFTPGRIEVNRDPTHDAYEHGSHDDAPERTQAPDDDHDESGGENIRAHRRVDAGDRRKQHAGKAGKPHAERGNCRHIGRKRDAERTDDIGVLHTRPHHATECGAINDEPRRDHGSDRYAEDDEAIAGR